MTDRQLFPLAGVAPEAEESTPMPLREMLDRDNIRMDLLGPYPVTESSSTFDRHYTIERARFVAVFTMIGDERILLCPSYTQSRTAEAPTAAAIFGALLSDATSAENARDWRDFANELGYDSDSLSARETYEACLKERDDLREFLAGLFDEYMSAEHDDD